MAEIQQVKPGTVIFIVFPKGGGQCDDCTYKFEQEYFRYGIFLGKREEDGADIIRLFQPIICECCGHSVGTMFCLNNHFIGKDTSGKWN